MSVIEEQFQIESQKLLESAIESILQMTYEERIDAHENARQLMMDLYKVGEELRATRSQGTS